jgi:hypothetical protein
MVPYTLAGTSLRAARAFFFRACIFEALHLTPMLLLLGLSAQRLLEGRPELALENTLINLVVNIYPILHHRHTRLRILRLLGLDASRRSASAAGDDDGAAVARVSAVWNDRSGLSDSARPSAAGSIGTGSTPTHS